MPGVLLSGHYTEIADKIKRNLEKQKKLRRNNSLIWRVELAITRRYRKDSVCIKAVLVWLKYCRNLWILIGAKIWAIDLFELQLTSYWGTYFNIIVRWYHVLQKIPIKKKTKLKNKPFLYKNGILLQSTTDKLTSVGKWQFDFFKNCCFSFKRERRILFITSNMF